MMTISEALTVKKYPIEEVGCKFLMHGLGLVGQILVAIKGGTEPNEFLFKHYVVTKIQYSTSGKVSFVSEFVKETVDDIEQFYLNVLKEYLEREPEEEFHDFFDEDEEEEK